MRANYSSLHQQRIAAIVAAAPKPTSAARTQFIEKFYAHTTIHNLDSLAPARAVEIAVACEKFHEHRSKRGPKIHVAPIKVEEDGRAMARTQIMALNDDMPFLVDSLSALFTSLGLTIHLILHPILEGARDASGACIPIAKAPKKSLAAESLIYVELSPLPSTLTTKQLQEQMNHVLAHVGASVADWAQMRDRTQVMAEKFTGPVVGVDRDEVTETRDLLLWLASNHFVFLGMADFKADGKKLTLDKSSALGIYRLPPDAATPGIEDATHATSRDLAAVLKASAFSLVHRHTPMDMIVLRRLDAKGKFVGELRILGLFTSTVYYRETQNIPFIRRKAANIMRRAGFDPQGHSGKTLKTILEFLPRDELFQVEEERLFHTAMGIVSLDAKPEVKLFVRPDGFERFVSAMVYVPRERFSSDLRDGIIRMLEHAYAGRSSTFYTQVTDSPLARLHVMIETTPGQVPEVDEAVLEAHIASRANVWADALRDAVIGSFGDEMGTPLAQSFANAFPPAYVNNTSAQAAAHDLHRILECNEGDGVALELFRASQAGIDQLHLNCFTSNVNSELSTIIPLLEHMGATVIDATPYVITPLAPLQPVLLRNFTLRVAGSQSLDLSENKARIEEAIANVWRGLSDNDTFNALVFSAALTSRDVEILRALSRYMQQLDFPYSQTFIASALNSHPELARALVGLFHARFDPQMKDRDAKAAALQQQIEAAFEGITNLAEDRIIRQFLALILAILRTNYYQTVNGAPKSYLSLKFQSNLVPEMKLPVPFVEIFVTARRMEGIHLRGGSVARGGLRWSDRPEDFRTEVLGLMKTQMVKNAVIVPQGAKGGFILRQAPSERDAFQAEGVECYKIFLRGLLDITDNIVNKKIIHPTNVVRYDVDDPYLVVAADKGTATFSDIANGISADYGFWLGDAFASGGSVGYDHKLMAITARGGWVAVERHFREMGHDIAKETFTTTGIGDMSGDVFGNGALLSKNMRLVAAFNHRHIFIDPTPDAATTYVERSRLFALPRSGWNDYDTKLISKGGGVFERSLKSIALTPEMRTALGTTATRATPDELIRIILKAPVDLLWNGGIGTYVKATGETHESVGDRANVNLRIDGRDLRAKIVGEGGNLGFTQRGRIEYARSGGRINTDAIDNSGGVDCSDHEVNIKIAFGSAVAAKRLTIKQRDALLKKMTDNVAELVLSDNLRQTQAISIAQLQGPALLEPASQLMTQLEEQNFLNRDVEALPDAKQLAELRSAKQGLTRPEIAVLLAYAKMAFFRDVKDADLLDAPYFEADLLRYFPTAMQKDFSTDIKAHRLRREIVATMITNSIVNRTGFSFAASLMQATGLPAADIAQAYIATRDAFGLRKLWAEIEALDGVASALVQSQLFTNLNQFIEHSCRWFLQHTKQPTTLGDLIAAYAPGIRDIEQQAESLMSESLHQSYTENVAHWVAQHVPVELAQRLAKLEIMNAACDIIDIARTSKKSVMEAGRIYFALGDVLKLGWLRSSARALAADNYWQQLAIKSLALEFYAAQRRLSLQVIAQYGRGKADAAAAWVADAGAALARHDSFIGELRAQPQLDYPMLIVALRQIQAITTLEPAGETATDLPRRATRA